MRRLLCSLLLLVFVLPALAAAECAAPDTPGVRICSPTNNATVLDVPAIDFNSTPAFGAQISKYIVYDNNAKHYQGPPGESGTTLIDGSIKNGLHKFVINVWDTQGNLYKGTVNVKVIGDGYPPCAVPDSPGVNFCGPPDDADLGVRYSVFVAAKGNSKITAMKLYVDGKQQEGTFTDFYGDVSFSTPILVSSQGSHKVTFNAWDSGGHVFSASRIIRSNYTRGYEECPPKGNSPCLAGFDEMSSPGPNAYVGTSFPISANIVSNSDQITSMKAWIDDAVVATSNGPNMTANVDNAPSGTHIFTLQAWEASGVSYRVQYNININVQH